MGARKVTSKESGAAQRRIIFLLIVCVHLVTSQRSDDEAAAEAPPCPPSPPQLPYSSLSLNSCPDHLITQILDALACTPPSVAPPPPPSHDGGDLHPVSDMMSDEELSTATFTEAVMRAFSASGKEWEILFKLIFPAAVCALFICEIPLRNLCPRFAQEQLLLIFLVNALMAFLLPTEWLWVPIVCFGSSLLTLIMAPWLP